jgi:hypothetical protein
MSTALQALIDQGAVRLHADGMSPADIARAIIYKHWAMMLDADKCELAVKGLAAEIRAHTYKPKQVTQSAKVDVDRKNRREKKAEVLGKAEAHLRKQIRHTVYGALHSITLDCNGRMQNLLRFTSSDLTAWLSVTSEQAGLWQGRKAWFERACVEMTRIRAARVADLPPAILTTLNMMAERAWERRDDARVA